MRHYADYDPKEIMYLLIKETKDLYTCTRPPGAAGAALYNPDTREIRYAGVYPPVGPTCRQIDCEIETTQKAQLPSGEEWWQGETKHVVYEDHCIRTIHAEQRLITDAALVGYATKDLVCFSILKPCYQCTKILIAAGIRTIYYAAAAYDEARTRRILALANVTNIRLNVNLDYGK